MTAEAPILIVPYMWIGDFVRCHTVVKLLQQRFPSSPIDVVTTAMVAPLVDYMPGVRQGIVADLARKRLAMGRHRALAARLREERYGQALVMPRTWKSALAPVTSPHSWPSSAARFTRSSATRPWRRRQPGASRSPGWQTR